jgi:hypothetical protein
MKEDPEIKIEIGHGRIVTLKELFEEHKKTHTEQAGLSFEEKIKALVDLQRLAISWGNRKDVIVWKI